MEDWYRSSVREADRVLLRVFTKLFAYHFGCSRSCSRIASRVRAGLPARRLSLFGNVFNSINAARQRVVSYNLETSKHTVYKTKTPAIAAKRPNPAAPVLTTLPLFPVCEAAVADEDCVALPVAEPLAVVVMLALPLAEPANADSIDVIADEAADALALPLAPPAATPPAVPAAVVALAVLLATPEPVPAAPVATTYSVPSSLASTVVMPFVWKSAPLPPRLWLQTAPLLGVILQSATAVADSSASAME